MIKLESVTKRYRKLTALENVSLDVVRRIPGTVRAKRCRKNHDHKNSSGFHQTRFRKSIYKENRCRLPENGQGVGYLPENIRIPLYLSGRDFLRRQAYLCSLHGKLQSAIDRALERPV